MTATVVPADLLAWRAEGMRITGLGAIDFGIAPNADHKISGGYHCGVQDVINIGRFPEGDYSTRQQRDRVGGNVACAVDPGDDWPNGGRSAWLRFNNLLVTQLRAKDPQLSAVRAVNFSPDGTACKRYDTLHPEAGIIASTDSVYMHTHIEFWRDTEGKRAQSLTRLLQIMRAAVNNMPLGDDDMDQTEQLNPPNGAKNTVGQALNIGTQNRDIQVLDDAASGYGTPRPTSMAGRIRDIQTKVAEIQAGQVSQEVVTAAVVAALQDPAVQAVLVAVSQRGANLAEDS
jgi:hypothetical protein